MNKVLMLANTVFDISEHRHFWPFWTLFYVDISELCFDLILMYPVLNLTCLPVDFKYHRQLSVFSAANSKLHSNYWYLVVKCNCTLIYSKIRCINWEFLQLKICNSTVLWFDWLKNEQSSKFSVANSYDGTTVQWKESRCPGLWLISISFISELKTVMWCLGQCHIYWESCETIRHLSVEKRTNPRLFRDLVNLVLVLE